MNVNIQQLIANINIGNAIVDISHLLDGNQIQALVQALNDNPQASQNADRLTSALQKKGALKKNERVVGVRDNSKVYKLNPTTAARARPQARSGSSPPRAGSASSGSSSGSQSPAASPGGGAGGLPSVSAGPVTQNASGTNLGQAMLQGLINVNIQQAVANVSVQNLIVSVSDVLNQNQLQVLLQALNQNPQASQNAARMSDALRQRNELAPNERVVGYTQGKIYKYAPQQ